MIIHHPTVVEFPLFIQTVNLINVINLILLFFCPSPHIFQPGESQWEIWNRHLVSKVWSIFSPLKPKVLPSTCTFLCICAAVRWRRCATARWLEPGGCRGSPLTRTSLGSSEDSTLPSISFTIVHETISCLCPLRLPVCCVVQRRGCTLS